MIKNCVNVNMLVMCRADPADNPRPNRIIRLLNERGYSVDLLSYADSLELKIQNFYVLSPTDFSFFGKVLRLCLMVITALVVKIIGNAGQLAVRLSDLRYKLFRIDGNIRNKNFEWIIVEDLQLLPLAFRICKNAKVLFDAREFYPRQNEENLLFRLLEHPLRNLLCREYLKLCHKRVTVSQGLAAAYKTNFGVDMTVIKSTPFYQEIPVKPTGTNKIRMVHHGRANRNRNLQNMIEVVRRLDSRFVLDFFLVGTKQDIAKLKREAKGCARIRFCEPVAFDQIVSMLNSYDIGFFYVEPSTLNLLHCLPNKFFEFIQARLAVVIGPSPNMAEIVRQFDCGLISEGFTVDSMVETLRSLTPEIVDRMKRNSDRAARELCYEKEGKKLLALIEGYSSLEVGVADRV